MLDRERVVSVGAGLGESELEHFAHQVELVLELGLSGPCEGLGGLRDESSGVVCLGRRGSTGPGLCAARVVEHDIRIDLVDFRLTARLTAQVHAAEGVAHARVFGGYGDCALDPDCACARSGRGCAVASIAEQNIRRTSRSLNCPCAVYI